MKRKMNKQQAVKAIVAHETSPIFTISAASRAMIANDYLHTLSERTQKRCFRKIQRKIDKYYEVIPGLNASPAELNEMMLFPN